MTLPSCASHDLVTCTSVIAFNTYKTYLSCSSLFHVATRVAAGAGGARDERWTGKSCTVSEGKRSDAKKYRRDTRHGPATMLAYMQQLS